MDKGTKVVKNINISGSMVFLAIICIRQLFFLQNYQFIDTKKLFLIFTLLTKVTNDV